MGMNWTDRLLERRVARSRAQLEGRSREAEYTSDEPEAEKLPEAEPAARAETEGEEVEAKPRAKRAKG